jgi:methionyl aminopeptidase
MKPAAIWIASLSAPAAPAISATRSRSRRYPALHLPSPANEEVVHSASASYKRGACATGDILSLDVAVVHNGYIGDNAVTVPVGAIAPRIAEAHARGERARPSDLGIAAGDRRQPHRRHSAAVQTHVEAHGFSVVSRPGRPRGRPRDARGTQIPTSARAAAASGSSPA